MPNLLERVNDEELKSKQNSVRAMIRREQKAERETIDLEKELCWLEREQEIRQKRYDLHKIYMESVRIERIEYEQMLKEEREAERELYKFDNDMSWRS